MLLSIDNLEVCYGVISALQGVSLQIDQGEVVTLIGSNGAGKTTLLRTISGLLRPRRGTISWSGSQTLNELRPDQIVQLGISHAPEGRQIFANLSVRENLLLGAYQEKSRERIGQDLDRVFSLFSALAERKNQRGGTLSGGEQQMLAIGRALMARPRLILFDEPSLGLAPTVVEAVFAIIAGIQREGTTVLMVEQNAYMALQLAMRAYVMETGRVTLEGPARELARNAHVRRAYLGG